jgi:hypothetical protein
VTGTLTSGNVVLRYEEAGPNDRLPLEALDWVDRTVPRLLQRPPPLKVAVGSADGRYMIVQLRGSMGAGKSTTVRRLLVEHNAEQIEPQVWRCAGDLYVPGSYRLDGPSPGTGGDHLLRGDGPERVRELAGHVESLIFEGYTFSTTNPKPWMAELGVVQAFIVLPPE